MDNLVTLFPTKHPQWDPGKCNSATDGKVKGTDEPPSTWSLPPLPDLWTYLKAWPQQFSLDFHGAFWSDCGTNLGEEVERFELGEALVSSWG